VGISTALIYGGAGAIFWMWFFTIFISVFSLIENTLAQVYKTKIDGEFRGGASYYIYKGLNNKYLAIVFALILVLTNTILFQPLQVNTISETLNIVFGFNEFVIFLILVAFTYFVIFKGTKRIVKFCEGIVPIMGITYFFVTLVIIIVNIKLFPGIISLIFKEAFNFKSVSTGIFCALIGFKRSLFSNEAGLGTAPSLTAIGEPKYAIQQGFVQVIGVFVDTIVICSLTGFVILIYSLDLSSYLGVDLIIYIFKRVLGNFGIYVSVFFLLTFATATVVSEYYLGESNLLYLIEKKKRRNLYNLLYKILFIIGIIIGIFSTTKQIFVIVDYGMIFLGCINLYALIKLRKVFDEELIKYYSQK
jgi:AGCS family alanine or glycine:cation symporter